MDQHQNHSSLSSFALSLGLPSAGILSHGGSWRWCPGHLRAFSDRSWLRDAYGKSIAAYLFHLNPMNISHYKLALMSYHRSYEKFHFSRCSTSVYPIKVLLVVFFGDLSERTGTPKSNGS